MRRTASVSATQKLKRGSVVKRVNPEATVCVVDVYVFVCACVCVCLCKCVEVCGVIKTALLHLRQTGLLARRITRCVEKLEGRLHPAYASGLWQTYEGIKGERLMMLFQMT